MDSTKSTCTEYELMGMRHGLDRSRMLVIIIGGSNTISGEKKCGPVGCNYFSTEPDRIR